MVRPDRLIFNRNNDLIRGLETRFRGLVRLPPVPTCPELTEGEPWPRENARQGSNILKNNIDPYH